MNRNEEYSFESDGFILEDMKSWKAAGKSNSSKLSPAMRNSVQPGQHVKLAFRFDTKDIEYWNYDTAYENLWVEILTRKEYHFLCGGKNIKKGMKYTGEIDNDSIFRSDFIGKEIEFHYGNIIDILGENGKGV